MLTQLETLSKLQNVYAPLPLTAHLVFCALATLLYAVLFNRWGKRHYLILIIAIDLTLMTQFWTSKIVIFALGISEVVLLITAGVLAYKSNKEEKKRDEERRRNEKLREEERIRRKEAEKLFVNQEYIDKNFVRDAFDDDF